jgi:hypothetical protein
MILRLTFVFSFTDMYVLGRWIIIFMDVPLSVPALPYSPTVVTDTLKQNREQQAQLLIIGLCILLRLYQLNIGITSVRNRVFFGARFYCVLLTLHVSAPFGGHLQVVRKHKKIYLRQSLYIQRIR